MKLTFKKARETKGTFVFDECDGKGNALENKKDGVIGSLYIRRDSEIGKSNPEALTVEINVKK